MARANPNAKPKATSAESEARTHQVLQWILNGASRYVVVRLCAEKWGIAERQASVYLARAHKLVATSLEADREKEIGLHVAKRDNLYALALETGEFRLALSVVADLAKLRGLYPTEKKSVDLTSDGKGIPVVSFFEVPTGAIAGRNNTGQQEGDTSQFPPGADTSVELH